jgi:hypothetical protein
MKSVNNRVAIGIDVSREDAVGKAFVYALQDQLNRSSILQYGTNSDEGLVLSIVSVNENPGNDNNNDPRQPSRSFSSASKRISLTGSSMSGSLLWARTKLTTGQSRC